MIKTLFVSSPLRSRWFYSPLCLALALAGCSKSDEFDGSTAPYGARTPTTQVHSTLTFSPGSLLGNTNIAQVTGVVGQKIIAGSSYDRLATTRVDDSTKGGEYWIKQNSDDSLDFAGFLHSSLVGGIVPAAALTFATPMKINLEPPLGQPQSLAATGSLTLTDTADTSSANVTGQYTLVEKNATVPTGMGPLSGCSHFSGQASSNAAGIPAAFQGQTITADLWYHASYGVVAFNAPNLGIGTAMTDSSDCGSIDSSNHRTIRKVGVVDSSSSFSLNTYNCDGNQFAADMDTHAQMLLELRWVDETQAKTDVQPNPTVDFGVASGNYFPNDMKESSASIFHPEENGKGFKYWYSFVNEADKNEDAPGDHATAYHITVGAAPLSAVRVTARIYYKVLPSLVGAQPDAGLSGGSSPDGGSQAKDAGAADAPADTTGVPSSCNLIVNGNAEAATGSADGTPVATPGWTATGEATAGQYGVNGWPGLTDPGPADRGLNLFSGGVADATSSLTQTINVAQFASSIDASRVTYELSGWLGGWQSQDDNATLTVTFQGATGLTLGTGTIGPVMGSDRGYATGLVQQSSSGAVPAGTRTVLVVLLMTRVSGSANDGYADDLSLVFSGTGAGACNIGGSPDGGTTCTAGPGSPLTLSGAVTTIAGSAGVPGSVDGTGSAARFNYPYAAATDGTNLYVVDTYNHTIRKIVLGTGAVTTLAGSAGISGSADGTGSAARFNLPNTIATDGTNLYVTDSGNDTIRKIVISTGVVTTIAGSPGLTGSADGTGSAARFYRLSGITTDNTNLFVADYGNNTIRKIVISTGVVTTIAGSAGQPGLVDGIGSAARLNGPTGITTDNTNLFVTENVSETIRKIVISSGAVTTIAGSAGMTGSTDGIGSAARFNDPAGITTDGTNLYVCDTLNHTIRQVVICTGAVTTIAGSAGIPGSTDGTGSAARFNEPFFITTDGTSLYVVDEQNSTVRKISGGPSGGTGQESILFKMESIEAVSYNPPQITTFTLTAASYVTRVWTYHYSATIGTKSPTVAFKDTSSGAIFGPWPQVGYKSFDGTLGATRSSVGNIPGPPDNYWMAYPAQIVPAGTYQVIDSDPTTWAYTADLGNRGSTWVYGYPTSNGGPDGGVRALDASADGKGPAGPDAPSTCGIGGNPAPVGTFDDDFSAGLRPHYWSVNQSASGLYSYDDTQGDVRLTKVGTSPGGFQTVQVTLNLQNFGGQVVGDFETSVDFSNAVIGPGVDQVQLDAYFDDSSVFCDVYDNSSGVNLHVWTGSLEPGFSTTVTAGTFRIARTGSTITAYFNGAVVWSSSSWTTGPLVRVEFVLQLQPGSDDNESVRFDNFHLKGGCVSP